MLALVGFTATRAVAPAAQQKAAAAVAAGRTRTSDKKSSPRHEDVHVRLRRLAADVHEGRHVLRRLAQLGTQPEPRVEHHLHASMDRWIDAKGRQAEDRPDDERTTVRYT